MSEDKGIQPIDVANLQHSEDLLKVEDILIEECEAKDMIGFRMTNCPATQKSVTPTAYLYEGKYNPTKEELDLLGEELRKKYATARGLSMFATVFPNQEIDVLDLMDATYGYKKIDYDYDKDE